MTLVALYYQYHYYSDDDDDDDDVVSLFSSTRRELEERNCSRHAELYNLSESCLKVVRLGFKSLPNPFLKPSFKIEVLSTTYYINVLKSETHKVFNIFLNSKMRIASVNVCGRSEGVV